MKKILFILSGNLSTTPRALKVINLLKEDFLCDIVLVNRSEVWHEKDKDILASLDLKAATLNLGNRPLMPWFLATIKEKLSALLYPLFNQSINISAYASNKSSIILWNYLKKQIALKYDLILGFGAGALYPAWKLSDKHKVCFAFDVEDYHPGEFIQKDVLNEKNRREFLMKQLLPYASLITFSSPLINRKTLDLIGAHNNHLTVLNSFDVSEFSLPKKKNGKLKLIWFSQKINSSRGLEILLPAIKGLDVDLTLIGSIDSNFYNSFLLEFKDLINLEPPLPQCELHKKLAEYDIGLAMEISTKDLNKQIALSNKILAYAQAGLYILATDTLAQKLFIEDEKERGAVCEQSVNSIRQALISIIKDTATIREKSLDRYNRAKDLSWKKSGFQIKEKIQNLIG